MLAVEINLSSLVAALPQQSLVAVRVVMLALYALCFVLSLYRSFRILCSLRERFTLEQLLDCSNDSLVAALHLFMF